MTRFLAGALAALLLMAAGALIYAGAARTDPVKLAAAAPLPPQPEQSADPAPLPATVPEASAKTREERRFDRYDKDRNGAITREEYLASRRKAYAKLDVDGDGRLSFDEWAVKTSGKFGKADADRSGAMSRAEFATTAVKRRAPARRDCPPVDASPAEEG